MSISSTTKGPAGEPVSAPSVAVSAGETVRPGEGCTVDALGGWPQLLGALADGRDLSRAEATAAMTEILSGRATEAQIAGIIVALRIKGETAEELTGMVEAMLAASEPLQAPAGALDIVGTGGSPHRRQHALNVSTMACVVAGAAGVPICKHGNRRASSTSGSFDFLETLGVRTDLSPQQLVRCMERTGIGFAFARTFHPAMRHAAGVRAELGIPTVFNVLGPLANPGRVRRQLLGTSGTELAAKMAGVLANLGIERAWVVSGAGGIDELTITGTSLVFDVSPAGVTTFELNPAEVGLELADSLDAVAGGSPDDNARLFRGLLAGEVQGPVRDIVLLNAAAGLVVGGVVDDLREGLAEAAAVVDDGRAAAKLAELVAVSAQEAGV